MKYLVLLVSIICSVNCFSQNPNPDLFQTWYLRFVQSHDLAPYYYVAAIQPQISPTLNISNTLDFNGGGACNIFNGAFSNVTDMSFETGMFSESALVCSTQIHNEFEDSYFEFLQSGGWYQITPEGTGLVLTMRNPIFGQAVYQNFALKSTDFDFERVAIYPNPSNSRIFINSRQLLIMKIQVLNSFGQNVKSISKGFEVVDISDLSSGIYILKIDTEMGIIIKKIIRE